MKWDLRETLNPRLKCGECGWEGKIEEAKCKYFADPKQPDEVTPEPVCPICESESLEVK